MLGKITLLYLKKISNEHTISTSADKQPYIFHAFHHILEVENKVSIVAGLAEPSGGRDGYAVGKDGSVYRYILLLMYR